MPNVEIYTADLPFERNFCFAADLSRASEGIYLVDEDGELLPTQYQTADARHSIREALRCALKACGSEFYVDPSDARSEEEQLEALVMNTRIH